MKIHDIQVCCTATMFCLLLYDIDASDISKSSIKSSSLRVSKSVLFSSA